jgi:hypothetical protein
MSRLRLPRGWIHPAWPTWCPARSAPICHYLEPYLELQ